MRDGTVAADPRLGRLRYFDPRSRAYLVRERLRGVPPLRGRAWRPGPTLNQGRLGGCGGWSAVQALNAWPVVPHPYLGDDDGRDLYFAAQQRDPWPGGEYPGADPTMGGTATVAVMEAGREAGLWSGYDWCGAGSGTPAEDVRDAIIANGPVLLGIDWPTSAMTTRPSGLIECEWDSIGGGHLIAAIAFRYRGNLPGEGRDVGPIVGVQQSWGPGYGVALYGQPGGIAWMLWSDVAIALERQGEAVQPRWRG